MQLKGTIKFYQKGEWNKFNRWRRWANYLSVSRWIIIFHVLNEFHQLVFITNWSYMSTRQFDLSQDSKAQLTKVLFLVTRIGHQSFIIENTQRNYGAINADRLELVFTSILVAFYFITFLTSIRKHIRHKITSITFIYSCYSISSTSYNEGIKFKLLENKKQWGVL